MDGFVCLTIVAVICVLGYCWIWYCRSIFSDEVESDSSTPVVTPDTIRSTHAARRTGYEFIPSLPTIYYGWAILCGIVLLIVTLVNAKELTGAEIGALIGYTVGSVLSMFAVGRVIELLQDIRDAVRNSPALSPSRPGDE